MKRLFLLIITFILIGCVSTVNYREKAEECVKLLEESEEINKWALHYLDSLEQRTKFLEEELKKCQKENQP